MENLPWFITLRSHDAPQPGQKSDKILSETGSQITQAHLAAAVNTRSTARSMEACLPKAKGTLPSE